MLYDQERANQQAKRSFLGTQSEAVSVKTSGSARLFNELEKYAEELKIWEFEVISGKQDEDNGVKNKFSMTKNLRD